MSADVGGGYLIPERYLTGFWDDRSGPIRRALAKLGLAKPTMVWVPGLLERAYR